MPPWLMTWLSWSTIGACGAIGASLLLAAGEGMMRGAESFGELAMGFSGLGLCTLAIALLMRGFSETGL